MSVQDVDWSVLGLNGRDGKDSTLWIGSAGTYTPCHQDTYGFNLVAQISGRYGCCVIIKFIWLSLGKIFFFELPVFEKASLIKFLSSCSSLKVKIIFLNFVKLISIHV